MKNLNLDFYLDQDRPARKRTARISLLFGLSVGVFSQLVVGLTFDQALIPATLTIGIVEFGRALTYRIPGKKEQRQFSTASVRPALLHAGVAFCLIILLLSIPQATALAMGSRLQHINPENAQDVTRATRILAAATNAGLNIPPGVIESSGKKLVAVHDAPSESSSWKAALAFVNYRTLLNEQLKPVQTAQEMERTAIGAHTFYLFSTPLGFPAPAMSAGGAVPIKEAADVHLIPGRSLNEGLERGNSVFILEGGGIILDDTYMKHVIIRNATVEYMGGPLQLQDVIFVNCKFILSSNDNGRAFANAILSQSLTTLTFD